MPDVHHCSGAHASLSRFLDRFLRPQHALPLKHLDRLVVFDWALPESCPQMLANVTIPKYFAQVCERVRVAVLRV